MPLVELDFPKIQDDSRLAYGGDQEWCPTAWHRICGCGPTNAANLCGYYAKTAPSMRSLYKGCLQPFDKQEFIAVIEDAFRFITPSHMGYPYAGKYVQKFRTYAYYRAGIRFDAVGCGLAKTSDTMYDFCREAVDSGNPASMLMLRHHVPELDEDNWHWVAVTGYYDGADGKQIVTSNCGERVILPAEEIFKRNDNDVVRLFYFKKK